MTWRIERPRDLTIALQVARDNVADGTLAVDADVASLRMPPFAEVSPKGPWDDYVEYHFYCRRCGEKFILFAETYHGTGGKWCVELSSD